MNTKMNLEKEQIKEQARREIIRHFVKFLKERGAYTKYRENLMHVVANPTLCTTRMKKYRNYIGFTYGMQVKILWNYSYGKKRTFNIPLATEFINYAFCWDDTPQRHGFWYKLSEEWRKYVQENLYDKYKHIISEY